MGPHQINVLRFAIRFQGWHTFAKDRTMKRAVKSLHAKGLLEINEFRQFRLRQNFNNVGK